MARRERLSVLPKVTQLKGKPGLCRDWAGLVLYRSGEDGEETRMVLSRVSSLGSS